MLRPDDIELIKARVMVKKSGIFATRESKEQFMAGHFGRGILLIAISLVKHRYNFAKLSSSLKSNFSFS